MASPVRPAADSRELSEASAVLNRSLGTTITARDLGRFQDGGAGQVFVLPTEPTLGQRLSGQWGLVSGVAVVRSGTPEDYRGLLEPRLRPMLPEDFAHLHYLALRPDARGQGNTTPLIAAAADWANKNQLGHLVGASWAPKNAKTSADLWVVADADFIGAVKMAAMFPSRRCGPCDGSHDCDCSALVYRKSLSDEELARWSKARTRQPGARRGPIGIPI